MKKEPVLVILGGLAAVVDAGLFAANAVGIIHLDRGQVAAIVAFVTSVCALAAAVIRSLVTPA